MKFFWLVMSHNAEQYNLFISCQERQGAEIRLKKGGLCCLEVDGMPPQESAVLHWALTPKQLRFMAH